MLLCAASHLRHERHGVPRPQMGVALHGRPAGSIQIGSPLPSGTWSIAGSSTWTSGPLSYSLSASTSQPLHFNASCTVDPRFDAGTLVIAVTKNSATSNVTIQFTACGQYTVTRS